MRRADGLKIAVLRESRACPEFIRAAAHAHRYVATTQTKNTSLLEKDPLHSINK